MALTWEGKEKELANANMMIAGATKGPGGSMGQLWDNPDKNPRPGDALFGVGKDGQTFFEFYKRVMGLDKGDRISKSSRERRDILKPFTKGLSDYDDAGGGRDLTIPTNVWIDRLKKAI